MAIEFVRGKDIERLNDQELRAVLNALLVADAAQHRVPLDKVDVSTRNNDPDAGIDALIEFPDGFEHELMGVW